MLICYGSWGKSLSARGYLGVGSLKLWVGGWVFKCRQWVGLFFRKIYILRRKFISGFVAVFLKLFMDLVASVVSRMLSLTKSAGRRHVLWFNSMGWFMVFPTSDAARAKVAVGTNMSVILALWHWTISQRLCGSFILILVWRMEVIEKILWQFSFLTKSMKKSGRAIFVWRWSTFTNCTTEKFKFSKADFNSLHDVDGWRLRITTRNGFSFWGWYVWNCALFYVLRNLIMLR